LLIFKEIAPIFGTCGQFFGRPRFHYYKGIESRYAGWRRPSPYPSPLRGEGRVRGPFVKKINAFVLVMEQEGLPQPRPERSDL